MQTFRAYLLNGEGKITWGEWIEAANDEEALAKAKELCGDDNPMVEVWLGTTKVAEDHCDGAAKAPPAAPKPLARLLGRLARRDRTAERGEQPRSPAHRKPDEPIPGE